MDIRRPFNLHKWIEENKDLLKPPVNNKQIYKGNNDYIVMVVGGPNKRKDYHYNETEELFYQLKGNIVVGIIEDGKPVDIHINEGDMFLLPGKIPHSPRRPADSVGLVVELYRRPGQIDGFLWHCESCGERLYEEYFELTDIVAQLPPLMKKFYDSEDLRTCKNCGHVMEKP